MKTMTLLSILCVLLLSNAPISNVSKMATCTGTKNCKACKNCKYCKHCAKGGGKCGVCK